MLLDAEPIVNRLLPPPSAPAAGAGAEGKGDVGDAKPPALPNPPNPPLGVPGCGRVRDGTLGDAGWLPKENDPDCCMGGAPKENGAG